MIKLIKQSIGQSPIIASIFTAIIMSFGTIAVAKIDNDQKVQDKISTVKNELSIDIQDISERTAKLEEAITTIKNNSQITQQDIKEILRRLK